MKLNQETKSGVGIILQTGRDLDPSAKHVRHVWKRGTRTQRERYCLVSITPCQRRGLWSAEWLIPPPPFHVRSEIDTSIRTPALQGGVTQKRPRVRLSVSRVTEKAVFRKRQRAVRQFLSLDRTVETIDT